MELLCSNILQTLKSEDGLILHREKNTNCMHHILADLNEYIFIGLTVNNNKLLTDIKGSSALYINRNVVNIVLTNLVNNANRFTKNGMIKITCDFETPQKHITVEDNGKGMSAATLEKLRSGKIVIGNRDNPELSGYGIGYSLIFRMLEAVNGSIDIQSEQGKGSKVKFSWSEAD